MGDLVELVDDASDGEVDELCETYRRVRRGRRPRGPAASGASRSATPPASSSAFAASSTTGGFVGFTDTFENLHGLKQLPGLAVQRLMADGYGFGAEGDWKTAALVRATKVMAAGLPGGTSFMEDYTYHLDARATTLVLGAHMLEICPSIAAARPSLRDPPAVASAARTTRCGWCSTPHPGPAVNGSLIDLGDRFRMVVNDVDVIEPPEPLPQASRSPAPSGSRAPT